MAAYCSRVWRFHFLSRASLSSLVVLLLVTATLRTPAATLPELAEKVRNLATDEGALSAEADAVSDEVRKQGGDAVPVLIEMLADRREGVRKAAAYVLNQMPPLGPEHLDGLVKAAGVEVPWIPRIIAKIGSPKAVQFLHEQFLRRAEPARDYRGALAALGPRVMPLLAKDFQWAEKWNDGLVQEMEFLFHELGARGADAIEPLLRIAQDDQAPLTRRIRAIDAVGRLGLGAERAVPALQVLRKDSDQKVSLAAWQAILDIGNEAAAELLADQLSVLDRMHDTSTFNRLSAVRQIERLGLHGKPAGPAVLKCLSAGDWDVRVAAARTLGTIGFAPAADALLSALAAEDDWRLCYTAAEALGRLQAAKAEPALARLAATHWFVAVRDSATVALARIHGEPPPKIATETPGSDFPWVEESGVLVKSEPFEYEDAERLRFDVVNQYRDVTMKLNEKSGILEIRSAFPVPGGQLSYYNWGEFGGGIDFIDVRGQKTVVSELNTEAVYPVNDGYVAVAGLGHMGMQYGRIYQLRQDAAHHWKMKPWRELPGRPGLSRLLKDGSLFVSCQNGIVLVSPHGTMRSLTRKEALQDE